MGVVDLKKKYPFYKVKAERMNIIDMPKAKYMMIEGKGSPENQDYQDCISALYSIVYTMKFDKGLKLDKFPVMPLDTLWYMDKMEEFTEENKDKWQYTVMIMVPDFVNDKILKEIKKTVYEKKKNGRVKEIKLDDLKEGLCLQTLHLGPYNTVGKTITKMFKFMEEKGYEPSGKYHEIYVSDPRRGDPANIKTIVRQPIKKK